MSDTNRHLSVGSKRQQKSILLGPEGRMRHCTAIQAVQPHSVQVRDCRHGKQAWSGGSCGPDPVRVMPHARVISMVHTSSGDGVRALLFASYPALIARSWYRHISISGGGGDMQNNKTDDVPPEVHRHQWATHTHWSAAYKGSRPA